MRPGVLLAVAAGGALGAVLRVLLGTVAMAVWPVAFPVGTLGANLLGSSLLGFLDHRLPPDPRSVARAFALPGVCGGFTTFSAFGVEVIRLGEGGRVGVGIAYVGASLVLCLAGVAAGAWLGRRREPSPGTASTPG